MIAGGKRTKGNGKQLYCNVPRCAKVFGYVFGLSTLLPEVSHNLPKPAEMDK